MSASARTNRQTKCGEKSREAKARTQVRPTQGSIAKHEGDSTEQEKTLLDQHAASGLDVDPT
jgi:hypothetical protein